MEHFDKHLGTIVCASSKTYWMIIMIDGVLHGVSGNKLETRPKDKVPPTSGCLDKSQTDKCTGSSKANTLPCFIGGHKTKTANYT